ncbi:hypothetical protein SPRG_03399 [Saprolegnia parasitica CBS 223.65]|uniref:Uncharacterized protein n=1 Tax=Saprolegnia parasitica (strain CBS 223.65) TaxID=695850 RepID=A0A067CZJ2_SAPPC|nr:hypothetical protein SPRG_03399 [Saprolegnia parasitica CBS 223.65]KDO32182.1 hypothetical protein SPRG_03399 [Saprolegnia parasitica CBS 223.65]|eukprot:XP_012197363.1 hypothetical protein SPRG_03399 [Saprolegnia parasitica CBS 223.65]
MDDEVDDDGVGELVAPPPPSPKHRRVWSVGVDSATELGKIQKAHEMSSLQTELAKQSRALEESQEETQLAARIGQSLLAQNQQLDYELKATLCQATARADDAERHARVLEARLAEATTSCRAAESQCVHSAVEIEHLHGVQAGLESTIKQLTRDASKCKDERQLLTQATARLHEENRELQADRDTLQTANGRLIRELEALRADLTERRDAADASDRSVLEFKTKLVGYDQVVAHLEALQAHVLSTDVELATLHEHCRALEDAKEASELLVAALTTELHTTTEQLQQERVITQEMREASRSYLSRRSSDASASDGPDVAILKQGSLFHELSLVLERDRADATQPLLDRILALETELASYREGSSHETVSSHVNEVRALRETQYAIETELLQVQKELSRTQETSKLWEAKYVAKCAEADEFRVELKGHMHACEVELDQLMKQRSSMQDELLKARLLYTEAAAEWHAQRTLHEAQVEQLHETLRAAQSEVHHLKLDERHAAASLAASTQQLCEMDRALRLAKDHEEALSKSVGLFQSNCDAQASRLLALEDAMRDAAETRVMQEQQMAALTSELDQTLELWRDEKTTSDGLRQRIEELHEMMEVASQPSPYRSRQSSIEQRRSFLKRGSLFHELAQQIEREVTLAQRTISEDDETTPPSVIVESLRLQLDELQIQLRRERARVCQLQTELDAATPAPPIVRPPWFWAALYGGRVRGLLDNEIIAAPHE